MINTRSFLGISMTKRHTRRLLVVGYWSVVLTLIGIVLLSLRTSGTFFGMPAEWPFMLIVVLMAGLLGGYGNLGLVRAFDGRSSEDRMLVDYSFMALSDIAARKEAEKETRLDERERNLRNAAHYKAYSAVRWVGFVCFFAFMPQQARMTVSLREAFLSLLFLGIWGLPQTIILWTEPDMEEPQ